MDDFDRKLLQLVQRNNRLTHEQLSTHLNLSATAIRRRLNKLRNEKTIVADVALVDPAMLGITVIVSVRFEKESQETYRQFKQQMLKAVEVAQCYTVSGEVDFIIVAHLPDLKSYEDWIDKHLLSNPSVARSDTNIVYSRVKYDTAIDV